MSEEAGGTTKTPSFTENFATNFLDIYKKKMFEGGGGGSSSSGSKASPFQVSDMGGSTISPFGKSGKHQLFQYIGSKPIIQTATPSAPGLGSQLGGAAAGAAVGTAAKFLLPKVIPFLCDERLKVDMAPLESTEVNDALAEVAFFVKGLRECA